MTQAISTAAAILRYIGAPAPRASRNHRLPGFAYAGLAYQRRGR